MSAIVTSAIPHGLQNTQGLFWTGRWSPGAFTDRLSDARIFDDAQHAMDAHGTLADILGDCAAVPLSNLKTHVAWRPNA